MILAASSMVVLLVSLAGSNAIEVDFYRETLSNPVERSIDIRNGPYLKGSGGASPAMWWDEEQLEEDEQADASEDSLVAIWPKKKNPHAPLHDEAEQKLRSSKGIVVETDGMAFVQVRKAQKTTSPLGRLRRDFKHWTCATTIHISFCNPRSPCLFPMGGSCGTTSVFCKCETNAPLLATVKSADGQIRSHVGGIAFTPLVARTVDKSSSEFQVYFFRDQHVPVAGIHPHSPGLLKYAIIKATAGDNKLFHIRNPGDKSILERGDEGVHDQNTKISFVITNEQMEKAFTANSNNSNLKYVLSSPNQHNDH